MIIIRHFNLVFCTSSTLLIFISSGLQIFIVSLLVIGVILRMVDKQKRVRYLAAKEILSPVLLAKRVIVC